MPNREIYDRFSSISCSPTHINKLYQELAASKAEVEHIKGLLKNIPAVHINTLRGNIAKLSWDSYEHIIGPHPCRERAEKAEAEVERLKELLNRAINEIEKTPFHTPKLTAFPPWPIDPTNK